MRDMIFLSHANPEDNDFALWLALRLAAEGYPVWCDLTKLLGGEEFWEEVESAIRDRTIKFVYALSESSNHKEGPRKELRVAVIVRRTESLKDFIIPVRIDDTPFSEFNIELSTKTAIDFSEDWASGLSRLLEKLETDKVGKKANFTPNAVADWWSSHASPNQGVVQEPEDMLSNVFPLSIDPSRIYVHTLTGLISLLPSNLSDAPFPAIGLKRWVVTFAGADDIPSKVLDGFSVAETETLDLENFVSPQLGTLLGGPQSRRNLLYSLLKDAWERLMAEKGLLPYLMANNRVAYCFTPSTVSLDRIAFVDWGGQTRRRALVGIHTVAQKRCWHFGIEVKPQLAPRLALALKYHVAFSNEGEIFWDDKDRAHRARRRVGRDWWNPEWRDRLLAAMSWLCDSRDSAEVPVGSRTLMIVQRLPRVFRSPVAFLDPGSQEAEDVAEEEDEPEEDPAESEADAPAQPESLDV